MPLEIPHMQETLRFGNVAKNVNPVLSNRQFRPDPVAPPTGAAIKQQRAQQLGQLAQGVSALGNVMHDIAIKRQEKRNQNDAIEADMAYKEGVFNLQQELQQSTGRDARGTQQKFLEKEEVLRSGILEGLNSNVKSRLEPLMQNGRLRGSQLMFNHEQKEMDKETTAATQLLAEQWVTESLNNADFIEGTDRALNKINSVSKDRMPGMTQSEIEIWRANQKAKVYAGHMNQLLADEYDPVAVGAAVDYFAKYGEDMSADTRRQFGPKIFEAQFKQAVETEFDSIKGMGYEAQLNHIASLESPAMQAKLQTRVNAHHAQQRAIRLERGRQLENTFFAQMEEAGISAGNGAKQLEFLRDYQLSMSPAQREAFRPRVDSLAREFSGNLRDQMNANKLAHQIKLREDPSGFFDEAYQNMMKDQANRGVLDEGWRASYVASAQRSIQGIDPDTGARTKRGPSGAKLHEDLQAYLSSWYGKVKLDGKDPSDKSVMIAIEEDLEQIIMNSTDASMGQVRQQGVEYINSIFENFDIEQIEPNVEALRAGLESWRLQGGPQLDIDTIEGITASIMEEARLEEMTPDKAFLLAVNYAYENGGILSEEAMEWITLNKQWADEQRRDDIAKQEYNKSVGADPDADFEELMKKDVYRLEHEKNQAAGETGTVMGNLGPQVGAELRYQEDLKRLEEAGFKVKDGQLGVPEGMASAAFSIAVSEGMNLEIRQQLLDTMSEEDIRRERDTMIEWFWTFGKETIWGVPSDIVGSAFNQSTYEQEVRDERAGLNDPLFTPVADFIPKAFQWLHDLTVAIGENQVPAYPVGSSGAPYMAPDNTTYLERQ